MFRFFIAYRLLHLYLSYIIHLQQITTNCLRRF